MLVTTQHPDVIWFYSFFIQKIFFRLICIFVGLTDFVKHGLLTLVDEILRYRNYHCYYYYYYYCCYSFAGTSWSWMRCSVCVCVFVCVCMCVCVCATVLLHCMQGPPQFRQLHSSFSGLTLPHHIDYCHCK